MPHRELEKMANQVIMQRVLFMAIIHVLTNEYRSLWWEKNYLFDIKEDNANDPRAVEV